MDSHRPGSRRGITVLTLLIIIILIVVAAVFLVRYLTHRPAVSLTPPPVTGATA